MTVRATAPPMTLTYQTIGSTLCMVIRGETVDPAKRPVVALHGLVGSYPWPQILTWQSPYVYAGPLWPYIWDHREIWVPYHGSDCGKDSQDLSTVSPPGTALDGIRDLFAHLGRPVDLWSYSGGGLSASVLAITDQSAIATMTLISPLLDLGKFVTDTRATDATTANAISTLWTGSPDATAAAIEAAMVAEGKGLTQREAGLGTLAARTLICTGTTDTTVGVAPSIAYATAAGIPVKNRFLTGSGGHLNAINLDPTWDDLDPLRMAATVT